MLSLPGGGCAWGDYDNDGYLDLFVSTYQGQNGLFHNNGDGTFTQILSEPVVNGGGNSVAWVDYDNDGSLDLFLTRAVFDGTTLVPNVLYHNNGNSNAWLEVRLVGTVANRSAIGAKVRVRATIGGKTFWQLREINNGGGSNTQPLVAHFGLGTPLTWTPWHRMAFRDHSGISQRGGQAISEHHQPPWLSASTTNGVPQFSLKAWPGMEFVIQASTDLATWSVIGAVTITNLNGLAQIVDTDAPSLKQRFYRPVALAED